MSYADYSKSVQDLNEHSDILSTLLKNLVYKADLPDNLCPSFHIIATILACIICCRKDENEKHHYGMLFTTIIAVILVALATLFTRQHYIVDILVAFVICEISYLIAQKFN
jgi:membrane-associated phospholipid phosphatase